MANEIQISATFKASKGYLDVSRQVTRLGVDLTTGAFSNQVQSIATAATQIDISDAVTTAGWAWFRNLDDTNFVEIGVEDASSNFIAMAKLQPGALALLPLATTTLYAQADTAAVLLETLILAE